MHVAGEASLICNKTKLVDSSGHGFRVVATIEGFALTWSGDYFAPHAGINASELFRARGE